MRASVAVFGALAFVACSWGCGTIQLEDFDRDMSQELIHHYHLAPVIVDQKRFATDLWSFYEGEVVMNPLRGFHAERHFDVLPLKLHTDERTAFYDLDGRLKSNQYHTSLLGGAAYLWDSYNQFDPVTGGKRLEQRRFSLLLNLLFMDMTGTAYAESGFEQRRKRVTAILAGLVVESTDAQMTDDGRRTASSFKIAYGLLGWGTDKKGAQTLYFLFIPIPLTGPNLDAGPSQD